MKIINVLRGGLGNQLFQWATSKYLENQYGCLVYQDINEYDYLKTDSNITKRKFSLLNFPFLKCNILTNEVENDLSGNKIELLDERYFNPIKHKLDVYKIYKLFGYWQNYSFFENIKSTIRQELSIPYDVKKKFQHQYPEIASESISLHIRRTDYLTSNGFHVVQPIQYFEKSLELIKDYDNLFIFSDDIDWCKQNLHFKNQIFVTTNSDYEDLWLMSLCKHNIISNSSFSWWGAWLNNNENKKVIIPTKWYSYGDNPSMSPKNWIKL